MAMQHATGGPEPLPAVLEVIAIALTCRDVNQESAQPAEQDPEFFPLSIQASAQAAVEAGAMLPLFETPPSDAISQVLVASVQREIMLRNPVYPHMLRETLRGLFSDSNVDRDCRGTLGFSGLEAVDVMEAVRVLSIEALEERFSRMEAARDASLPMLKSINRVRRAVDGAGAQFEPQLEDEHRAVAEELFAALEDLTTYVDHSAAIDIQAVAGKTGYTEEVVEAVLDAFTLQGITDVDEAMERFFHGDNPLRTAPLVRDQDGRRMLVHDALALPAVREVIETKLKAAGKTSAYDRHRGRWVEDAALDLIAAALPGAAVHRSFNYFVPDPKAAGKQDTPAQFTKRVEADGLIIVDDVALIIEVKAVSLTAEARGGVARRLQGKLRDIVTSAANQAERLRERIVEDKRIRLDDDKWIEVGGIREIHTIAVGLEDLSGVTTATAMLVDAGVLKPENIPWTVSLHDLRIVSELVERPCELLLYLRRRTHPDVTKKFLAVDELDLYLQFLRRGLYVEPDPKARAEALPWTGSPTVASLRRHAAQGRELIASQTAPLDAWYEAQREPSNASAEKPRLPVDAALLKLIDNISEEKPNGWLSTTAILLEGSDKVQRKFGRYARDLSRAVKQDGRHHSVTNVVTDTAGNPFVLAWACPGKGESVDEAHQYLQRYLSAKKYQMRAHRAALMLFDSRNAQLLELLFDNRLVIPDENLARDATQLIPIDAMGAKVPRPGRAKRGNSRR